MIDKKTSLVRFRCTPEQRKLIESSARNEGKTLSEYLLGLVLQDAWKRRDSVMMDDEKATDRGAYYDCPPMEINNQ